MRPVCSASMMTLARVADKLHEGSAKPAGRVLQAASHAIDRGMIAAAQPPLLTEGSQPHSGAGRDGGGKPA
jgi:hypothetical protein